MICSPMATFSGTGAEIEEAAAAGAPAFSAGIGCAGFRLLPCATAESVRRCASAVRPAALFEFSTGLVCAQVVRGAATQKHIAARAVRYFEPSMNCPPQVSL